METLKQIFTKALGGGIKERGISFYLTAVSFVFSVAMLIMYVATGVTQFTPTLSEKVIALLCVCIALAALFSIFEVKVGKYVLYVIALWTWLEYLISEALYISNVAVSIDGNSISVTFVITVLFGLIAWVAALVAAILQKSELGSAKTIVAEEE